MSVSSISALNSSYNNDWMERLKEAASPEAEAKSAKSAKAEKTSSEKGMLSQAEIAGLTINAKYGFVESLLGGLGSISFTAKEKEASGLSAIYNSFSSFDLISSGAFGKLAKGYFSAEKSGEAEKAEAESKASESAAGLKDAADGLSKKSLYSEKDGEYDRKDISSAVGSFVEGYNKTLDDIAGTSSLRTLQKGVSMVGMTAAVSGVLSRVGISIGEDNQLSVDEEKLEQAEISDLRALFEGSGSYGSAIGQKAAMVASNADVSGYSANGSYNYTAYTNGIVSVQV